MTVTSTGLGAHNVALAPSTELQVQLNVDCDEVEVIVFASTAPIFFTVDGSAATVNGDNCYVAYAGPNTVAVQVPGNVGNTLVRLITTGTASLSVVRST